MQTITKQEFQKWIQEQPADRDVDMNGNDLNAICACVMVQFGLDQIPAFKAIPTKSGACVGCGTCEWEVDTEVVAKFENELELDDVIRDGVNNKADTFGELKQQLV